MPRKTRKRGKRDRRGRGNKRTYTGGTNTDKYNPTDHKKTLAESSKRTEKQAEAIHDSTQFSTQGGSVGEVARQNWNGGGKRTRKRSRTKRKKTKMKTKTQRS